MAIKITMPALSPTMTHGKVARWLKTEGDEISAGDVLAEIETDKATMEVEAVDEGVLGCVLVKAGTENVAVNDIIGLLLENGEDQSVLEEFNAKEISGSTSQESFKHVRAEKNWDTSSNVPKEKQVKATPLARRLAIQKRISISKIRGTGPRNKVTKSDVLGISLSSSSDNGVHEITASFKETNRIFASPLARRVAREAGLQLASLNGSGPNGRIIVRDVNSFITADQNKNSRIENNKTPKNYDLIQMSTMRNVIAERMSSAKQNVPHFYLTLDCGLDALIEKRTEINNSEQKDETKSSINDFIIKACALALMKIPEVNVSYVGDGKLRKYLSADISVAVAIDGGLITPIVRDAQSKNVSEITQEMRVLVEKAKTGKLMPEEYQGGSFSISNLGMFGIKNFDAIINEPQGAILAVGAGEERPVVNNGELTVATLMSCTLSCDHRVIDGATGAMFLSEIKRFIETPSLLFA